MTENHKVNVTQTEFSTKAGVILLVFLQETLKTKTGFVVERYKLNYQRDLFNTHTHTRCTGKREDEERD